MEKQQTDTHTSADKRQLKSRTKHIPFLSGSVFSGDDTVALPLYGSRCPRNCVPLTGTATVKVSETADFNYITDLAVTQCVC